MIARNLFRNGRFLKRALALVLAAALAGCAVVPKAPPPPPPPPPPPTTALPTDVARHRVALLVPMAGQSGPAGEDIANATTMALLDTNAKNLRITTYDTSLGAPAAAAKAIADGNRLILGPLLGADALAVAQTARGARVPVITYTSDAGVAGDNVFVMGNMPAQAITREVRYALAHGSHRFAALIPIGTYGERASAAMLGAVRAGGGVVVDMESYDRANGSIAGAVRRLKTHGAYDTVLIADAPRIAALAAPLLVRGGAGARAGVRILGTELWDGEALPTHVPALNGAIYAALADDRFHGFADRYRTRFGGAPHRIASLGYDSVLLTLRVAREWQAGTPFPTTRLFDQGGFVGIDGAFRFGSDDVVERAFEIREIRNGGVAVMSGAPTKFGE